MINIGFKVNLIEEDFDNYIFPSVSVLLTSWYGITDSQFDSSKADQSQLEAFINKQKYAGQKSVLKQPVIRTIFSKN